MNSTTQFNPWTLSLCLLAAFVVSAMPDLASATAVAGGSNVIGNTLCRVVNWFQGPVGQGIATMAIIIIGVGALMGKVSWGMAIIVGVGVAVVFGAGTVVGEIAGNSGGC